MSGSGQVALPDVQEWSGVPPGCTGLVGSPSRMSGSGGRPYTFLERLADVHKTSRISGSGLETLLDVQEAHSDVRE